jgi:hypothetical protein
MLNTKTGTPKKRIRYRSISGFVSKGRGKKLQDLPTDARVLFDFLTLLVDIRYRIRYGEPFDARRLAVHGDINHKQLYSNINEHKTKTA